MLCTALILQSVLFLFIIVITVVAGGTVIIIISNISRCSISININKVYLIWSFYFNSDFLFCSELQILFEADCSNSQKQIHYSHTMHSHSHPSKTLLYLI